VNTGRPKKWQEEPGLTLVDKLSRKIAPRLVEDRQQALLTRINDHTARIAVIGAGYVGLTLAVEAARVGFPVDCYEIDQAKLSALCNGTSDIPGVDNKELLALQKDERLQCTDQMELLSEAEVIVICVATPLNEAQEPDTSQIETAAACIHHYLQPSTLVILESTSYPGTTEELLKPALEASGLHAETDFWLAFSPERVDPGNTRYMLHNTPKVVAGMSPASKELVRAFYAQMIEKVVVVSSPAAAEMVKLYENIFRNINIAFANEMALLCDRMELDIWEVIDAAATKPYGFMPFYPGPGPGGHCIPVDPHYLSWKARQHSFHCKFIELASSINDEMPHYVCAKVSEALNQVGKPLKGSRVLILGAAYKPDISDVRESPIFGVFPLLAKRQACVSYHDPYVTELHMKNPGSFRPVPLTPETLQEADCVVILTDHACYPYQEIADHANLIVDCKNALRRRGVKGSGVVVTI
jgi:UDP-N-acetyl-D-glucosamine dehydrogenase